MRRRAAVAGAALVLAIAAALTGWLTHDPNVCSDGSGAGDSIAFWSSLPLGAFGGLSALVSFWFLVRQRRVRGTAGWNVLAFVLSLLTLYAALAAFTATADVCLEF